MITTGSVLCIIGAFIISFTYGQNLSSPLNTNETLSSKQKPAKSEVYFNVVFPFCCDKNEQFINDECQKVVNYDETNTFWPIFPIHWRNKTNFDRIKIKQSEINITFTYNNLKNCNRSGYYYEEDFDKDLKISTDGSLLKNDVFKYSDDYCMVPVINSNKLTNIIETAINTIIFCLEINVTLPFCCKESDQYLAPDLGCTTIEDRLQKPKSFWPLHSIHWHNETHFDTEPFKETEVSIIRELTSTNCSRYTLEKDEGYILQNGSLLMLPNLQNTEKIVDANHYCIGTIKEDNGTLLENTILLCFNSNEESSESKWYIIYGILLLVSAACLLVISALFLCNKNHRAGEDGKCIIGYTLVFAIAFIILAIAQLTGVREIGCRIIGIFFQFFLTFTFGWLVFYGIEVYRTAVCYYKEKDNKPSKLIFDTDMKIFEYTKSFKAKLSITLIIAFLVTLCSALASVRSIELFRSNFGKKTCYGDESMNTMESLLLHLPILILILLSLYFAIRARFLLRDYTFTKHERLLQIKRRGCIMVIIVMGVCWAVQFLSSLIGNNDHIWMAIDIINTLQGVIVMTLILQVIAKFETGKQWWKSTVKFRENEIRNCNSSNGREMNGIETTSLTTGQPLTN